MNFFEHLKSIAISEVSYVAIAEYKSGEKTTMQNRPWYGLAFSLGGELYYRQGDQKISLNKNSLVILPMHSTYEAVAVKPGAFAIINFSVAAPLHITDFCTIHVKNPDIYKSEFQTMRDAFIKDKAENHCKLLSSLYQMLAFLLKDALKTALPPMLHSAIRYIENNLHSVELSNHSIAKHLGISEVYLRKLFSQKLCVSVNRYIQNQRIEHAKRLLCETVLSITEISEQCGFSCIYYFCRSFKKHTGYTPTQYKNTHASHWW